jgi:catechol 2,3-dioxygenase-like lactoylglutathione lyase family enzyme
MSSMAYRFLLEVPTALADQANVAVAAAGDAQIVVQRAKAHRQGFADPAIDMTIAAHSLTVTQTLIAWYESLRSNEHEIGIVLHSGERLSLGDHNRASLIAAIRKDQPWVERSAPKIGDHDEDYRMTDVINPVVGQAAGASSGGALAASPDKAFTIAELNHLAVRVYDLQKAEAFYRGFLSFDLLGRARIENDEPTPLPNDFDWAIEGNAGADVSYLQNGPLTLAVHRVGLGGRIDRTLLEHIALRVDATSFMRIKGQALMRGYEIIGQSETDFAFRDPFNIVWDLNLAGNPVFASPYR